MMLGLRFRRISDDSSGLSMRAFSGLLSERSDPYSGFILVGYSSRSLQVYSLDGLS